MTQTQSEALFHAIFEQSLIGIELFDAEGRLIEQNQVCLDLFGVIDPAEVRHFQLFDDPNLPAEYKTALRKGLPVRYRVPFDFERVKSAAYSKLCPGYQPAQTGARSA